MRRLSEAHLYAIRTFAEFPLGSDEVETIDLDAGKEVIAEKYVELYAPLVGGNLRFLLTDSGRAALAQSEEKKL